MTKVTLAADASLETRFGVYAAGVGFLLGPEQSAEFVSGIKVFPIPRVSRRLRGAAQVRGHPVLVFSADLVAPAKVAIMQTCSIVMLKGAESALAFQVEQAPFLLSGLQPVDCPPLQSSFSNCLTRPQRARVLGLTANDQMDPRIWWEADFVRLFEALAND